VKRRGSVRHEAHAVWNRVKIAGHRLTGVCGAVETFDQSAGKEAFLRRLVALLLFACAGPAWSAPVLSMNWGSCTGPTHQANTGAHSYSLYISVTGIDRPHQAYEVWLGFTTARDSTPDAWVFDPGGCHSQSLATVAIAPGPADRKACPPLDAGKSKLKFTTVRLRPTAPYGTMQCIVANTYPVGVTEFDPRQRYLLARIDFDHSASVEGAARSDTTCGGFEQKILFRAQPDRCNYLTTDGVTLPLECGNGAVLASFGGTPEPAPTAATTKTRRR
jgi:hypothetical protein